MLSFSLILTFSPLHLCYVSLAYAFNPIHNHLFSSLSFPPHLQSYPHPPTPKTYILFPHFLTPLAQYAKPAPAPCYVSLLGQHCQQLEHITANCATCGPMKSRKREEEGTALCQWWGGRVPYSILDTATKHNVITNKRWFNQGAEYCWIDRLQM